MENEFDEMIELDLDDSQDDKQEKDYKTLYENQLKATQEARQELKKYKKPETNASPSPKKISAEKIKSLRDKYEDDIVDVIEELVQAGPSPNLSRDIKKIQVSQMSEQIPGIADHADEVIELAEKSGLTLEQSYYALYGKEAALKSKQDIEQEVKRRLETQPDGVDMSSEGEVAPGDKTKFTPLQIRAMTEMGMDTERYKKNLQPYEMKRGGNS